jgi:glycosyltransferase involved in cell wall biosynthesis
VTTAHDLADARVLVIIPTYQERDSLPLIVARVRTAVPAAHILVADDNSPDGTGKIADELAASDAHVHVLHHPAKQGLGAAYVAGFGWALGAGYDVIVEMDADGSHQPEQLPTLLDAIADADVVLGSRWVAGGQVSNWPKSREVLSRGANAYARFALGIPLRDATGGYRAYRAQVLRSLDLTTVRSQGYCFQVDMALRSWQRGYRVVEVPISFVERALGASKMNRGIVFEALWRVTVWGVRARLNQVTRRRPSATRGRPSA